VWRTWTNTPTESTVVPHASGLGHEPLLVDGGGFGVPQIRADIPREAVAAEGGLDLVALATVRRSRLAISAITAAAGP